MPSWLGFPDLFSRKYSHTAASTGMPGKSSALFYPTLGIPKRPFEACLGSSRLVCVSLILIRLGDTHESTSVFRYHDAIQALRRGLTPAAALSLDSWWLPRFDKMLESTCQISVRDTQCILACVASLTGRSRLDTCKVRHLRKNSFHFIRAARFKRAMLDVIPHVR